MGVCSVRLVGFEQVVYVIDGYAREVHVLRLWGRRRNKRKAFTDPEIEQISESSERDSIRDSIISVRDSILSQREPDYEPESPYSYLYGMSELLFGNSFHESHTTNQSPLTRACTA